MEQQAEILLIKARALEHLRKAIEVIGNPDDKILDREVSEDIKKAMKEISITTQLIAKKLAV